MAIKKKTSEPHRSFTVRVPLDLYIEIGDLARSEGSCVNKKVNQLIRLGMDKHISLDAALARLLRERVLEESNA